MRTAAGGSSSIADDLGRRHDLDAAGTPPGSSGAIASSAPDEQDADAELLGGLHRARDDLAGRAVAAHRVDGDR